MASITDVVREYRGRAQRFQTDAQQVFSKFEQSNARVITIDESRKRLSGLSIQQNDLLYQAVTCVEYGIYRASHVMAWAAFVDLLEEKLASDGLVKVHTVRPAWVKYPTIEEIRENLPEQQLVEVAREVGLLSKSEMKSVLGLLAKRNECAHPSEFKPDLNESLGYVADLLKRIERLSQKTL